jgi:hypothetical protein
MTAVALSRRSQGSLNDLARTKTISGREEAPVQISGDGDNLLPTESSIVLLNQIVWYKPVQNAISRFMCTCT